ncbi:hypothetical protein A1OE_12 [Candidatus Endolissoclinum faulkneri L2]|uniref:Uncharacterized protein n=1 Tax=Candidatus Endolissoclinum faulkneri L2 TaxID=1193729 RepID=K7YL67_9PROT|nr:hypothetical protein A1OE_12 [Candidatus Endolissoclinum faulkneri L2]
MNIKIFINTNTYYLTKYIFKLIKITFSESLLYNTIFIRY